MLKGEYQEINIYIYKIDFMNNLRLALLCNKIQIQETSRNDSHAMEKEENRERWENKRQK